MTFIKPMLASPLPETFDPSTGEWFMEEKFDGHRLIVATNEPARDLFQALAVQAWSRNGIVRPLPRHLREVLDTFPTGTYDGELIVPGSRSYNVKEVINETSLELVIFDVLSLLGKDVTREPWIKRRGYLCQILDVRGTERVRLAEATMITDMADLHRRREEVWARDGEGLILKHGLAPYRPGKRDKMWLKIKKLCTAVTTLTGFVEGRNGPHATVLLRDDEDQHTTVKTPNDATLAYFDEHHHTEGGEEVCLHARTCKGRRVRIEYQERTPDGAYRHPRWDRWEDE